MTYLNVRAVSDDDDADVEGEEQQGHLTARHHVDGAVIEGSTDGEVALEGDQHEVVGGECDAAPVEGLAVPAVAHEHVDVVVASHPHERLAGQRSRLKVNVQRCLLVNLFHSIVSSGDVISIIYFDTSAVAHGRWSPLQVTFTPCVGSFTSSGIDTRNGPTRFNVTSETHSESLSVNMFPSQNVYLCCCNICSVRYCMERECYVLLNHPLKVVIGLSIAVVIYVVKHTYILFHCQIVYFRKH